MARLVTVVLAIAVMFAVVGYAGAGTKSGKGQYEQPYVEKQVDYSLPVHKSPAPDWSTMRPTVGTYTTLSGFYDYQSNGGSIHYIRTDPANGNIHVIFMTADDSANASGPTRGTAYAYSTNAGQSWNNFSDVRVPTRRSGFPSLTLGTASGIEGSPIIANHNDPNPPSTANNFSFLYLDIPPGSGNFAEIPGPPPSPDATQPIWPYVASTANGTIVMSASPNVTPGPDYYGSFFNLSSWSAWTLYPGTNQTGGRYPVAANGTGRVGVMLNTSNGSSGNYWLESTNNGTSWPATATELYGLNRVVGADTFSSYVHCDVVYNGNTPLFVMDEYDAGTGTPSNPRILFYSQPTGYVVAVPYDSIKFPIRDTNPQQRFHNFGVGWPSIGISGSTIVIAFQVFQSETSPALGYNFSDVWYTQSTNGGVTWTAAQNLTNTPNLDERYPSVSKWNPTGHAYIVWQEDTEPGAHAFADLAPITRSSLVFLDKSTTVGVEEGQQNVPTGYALGQNYPNPFNPATQIEYTVGTTGPVTIKVFNSLGQEVATLLDQNLTPGQYSVSFDGSSLASGVYMYKMQGAGFTETRKMLLVK